MRPESKGIARAVARMDGSAVLFVQHRQRLEKNIRLWLASFDIFGADDCFEVIDKAGGGEDGFDFVAQRARGDGQR